MLGKLTLELSTEGWRFPDPVAAPPGPAPAKPRLFLPDSDVTPDPEPENPEKRQTRLRPPSDTVVFKERLLYLLQPPLENIFSGRQILLPFKPFPYQLDGIAFLMPRHAALIADEMGLGKTMQTIVALRLLLHAGLIRNALVVCPKPLVINWTRELRSWAEDVPFEVVGGDTAARKATWFGSKCPLKLVNYELLTRDADFVADERVRFDVVVLDEAQRIKNRESKTAQVVRSVRRTRSWAMTGTPIENRVDDLVNIFAFVDAGRIPPETPAKMIPQLTKDCIIRRVKEEVAKDMPPKIIRDAFLELSPQQREAYTLAEKEGIIHLNELGDTITVQHVFELVMRLKQICNFDPRTGSSSKLEQLQADMAEVAESNRKAIVFSQYIEPLEVLAQALAPLGPLQYHGKIPTSERQPILDRFKNDPKCHVLLMSYGTGSVGLNLQFTNYVFLFDRWWNPAIEDQAINRAHRLGQKSTVFVTRFITQNTIEGRINEVLERKRQLFNELIGQGGAPTPTGMTQDEIFGLFDIRKPKRAAA
jgi:SNF2 family DNA or RNA helicase